MPQVSLLLQCSVNPGDQLVVYVTDVEHPPMNELALVMTNNLEQKISVILSRDDAIRLQNHINDFIINDRTVPAIAFPCHIQFTVHTYKGTSRTSVYMIDNQAMLDAQIDFYMSDTTGETKSVTHTVYTKKG